MFKSIFQLFKIARKLAVSGAVETINEIYKVPLFIRGLELKKRGVSDILKAVCNDILKKSVNVDNILTIMEIVQNKIIELELIHTTRATEHFKHKLNTSLFFRP